MMHIDEEELLAGEHKHTWEDGRCLIQHDLIFLMVSEDACNIAMVGNLPFGVSTELMLKWIRQIPERKGAFAYGTQFLLPNVVSSKPLFPLPSTR